VIHHRHRIRESATSPFVRDVYPCEEETDEGLQEVLGIMTALMAPSDPSVRLIAFLTAIVSAVAPGACSVRPETIRMLGISRLRANVSIASVFSCPRVSHVRCTQFVSSSLYDKLSPLVIGLINKSSPRCDASNILASSMNYGVGCLFVSRTIPRIGYDDIAVNLK